MRYYKYYFNNLRDTVFYEVNTYRYRGVSKDGFGPYIYQSFPWNIKDIKPISRKEFEQYLLQIL